MAETTYALLALAPVLLFYLYSKLSYVRYKQFSHIPSLPTSLIFGHLRTLGNVLSSGDKRRHIDYVLWEMRKRIGNPDVMFVDIRPVDWYPMCLISSHDVAEQISRVSKSFHYSVPKSPTLNGGLGLLIGPESILCKEGEDWKSLRRRFNNGFAPQHLLTQLPQIFEKTNIFMGKIDALAKSGEEFEMDGYCTNLTFDIIGAIVMNLDFGAQGDEAKSNEVVRTFRTVIASFIGRGPLMKLRVMGRIKRVFAARKMDAAMKRAVQQKFEAIKATRDDPIKAKKDRSVVALALKDTDVLTPQILQSTADQVKTFLFAGHDTTSILLQHIFYALSVHPKVLATLRAEHDNIFGTKDPEEVFLARPDETMRALSYTSAVIKETLRLWPPAGSARLAPKGSNFRVHTQDGQEYVLDGMVIYLSHYIIQRDPRVYGETVDDFIPERWLGDTDTSETNKDADGSETGASKIPISAWRVFERGPRNCIGQELANIEARVILACVMRRYDFTKVGDGEVELDKDGKPVVDEKGKYKTKSDMFNILAITAKPVGGCRMKVRMHQHEAEL